MDTARENADVTRFVAWFLPPGNMVVFQAHSVGGGQDAFVYYT